MKTILWVYLISMVPGIELRASIPIGCGMGLPWLTCMVTAVLGSLTPVLPTLLLFRKILVLLRKVKFLHPVADWFEQRAMKGSKKLKGAESIALLLFVAIPLPGTGAWTGSMVAALLDIRMRYAFPAIAGGVVIAAAIFTIAAYGVTGAIGLLI